MNKFDWFKGLGFGGAIWLIMFALVSALVGFGVEESTWSEVAVPIIAGVVAYLFARTLDIELPWQALAYGLLWVAIGVALDMAITYQFNHDIFKSIGYWVGYVLVAATPWLNTKNTSLYRSIKI